MLCLAPKNPSSALPPTEVDAEVCCIVDAGPRSAAHSRTSSLHHSGSGVLGAQGFGPAGLGPAAPAGRGDGGAASLMEAAMSKVFSQRDG